MTSLLLLQGLTLLAAFVLGVIATCIHKWDETSREFPETGSGVQVTPPRTPHRQRGEPSAYFCTVPGCSLCGGPA